MNFADIRPAELTPEVGWWLINQSEEWIDKWGNIHRIAEMDDDYIINLHRFLGDKKYGRKLVGELTMLAEVDYLAQHGNYPPRQFTQQECEDYFKNTPLWGAVQKRATQARLRKASAKPSRYFDDTQPITTTGNASQYKVYRRNNRGGII